MEISNETVQWAVGIGSTVLTSIGAGVAFFIKKIALPTLIRLKKMDQYMAKVDRIYSEVMPNGGGSIKDQVVAINKSIGLSTARLRVQSEMDVRPTFETDENGDCRWVNRAYCRTFGYSPEELLEQGWKNIVYPDDLPSVAKSWQSAVDDAREYHGTYRVISQTGTVSHVYVQAHPLLSPNRELLGYLGFLTVTPVK